MNGHLSWQVRERVKKKQKAGHKRHDTNSMTKKYDTKSMTQKAWHKKHFTKVWPKLNHGFVEIRCAKFKKYYMLIFFWIYKIVSQFGSIYGITIASYYIDRFVIRKLKNCFVYFVAENWWFNLFLNCKKLFDPVS